MHNVTGSDTTVTMFQMATDIGNNVTGNIPMATTTTCRQINCTWWPVIYLDISVDYTLHDN